MGIGGVKVKPGVQSTAPPTKQLAMRFWLDKDCKSGKFCSVRGLNEPNMRMVKVRVTEKSSVAIMQYDSGEFKVTDVPTLYVGGLMGYLLLDIEIEAVCNVMNRVLWEKGRTGNYMVKAFQNEDAEGTDTDGYEWDMYLYEDGSPKFLLGENWIKL